MDFTQKQKKTTDELVPSMQKEEQPKPLEEQKNIILNNDGLLPPAQQKKQDEMKQEEIELPDEMTDALDEVLAWTKVKVETSTPVRNAADALKKAKTNAEKTAAMNTLANACNNYIEKNGGSIFKSSRRKQVVRTLLDQIDEFGNTLSKRPAQQPGQKNRADVLKWNGHEVKETVFKELELAGSEKRERQGADKVSAERYMEVFGEESRIPGFEDKVPLQMPEGELTGEAAQRAGLRKHIAAECEKLTLRRKLVRSLLEPRVPNVRMEGISKVFKTAEDKEALREWGLVVEEGKYSKEKGKYKLNGRLFNPQGDCMGEYRRILGELQTASIDEFLDGDDGEFASSFAEKYDKLCKYASAGAILKVTEEAAKDLPIPDTGSLSISEVRAKIRFFKEMKENYEDRLRLMSSPFYVTQEAGDMAKYLGPDGEKEKEKVTDPKLLEYITLYQKVQGSRLAMGKGGEAKAHYEEILDESRREKLKKDEETVKSVLERIKEGKAAEEAYKRTHELPEMVQTEVDADSEISGDQIKLFNQLKVLNLSSYPEDDVEFVRKVAPNDGGELMFGLELDKLASMENILVDVLLTGKVGGEDIEPALLKEVKEKIHDFISARRELVAEAPIQTYVSRLASGMGIDLNNPMLEQVEGYKDLKRFISGEAVAPEAVDRSLGMRRREYSDKMSFIFRRLIGAGYNVFPKLQDPIEKESEKTFYDDVKAKKKAKEPGISSFTVNGREFFVVDEITQGLLNKAAGFSFNVPGKAGEELVKLLEEQQKLLERTYYVRKHYFTGANDIKLFINEAYRMYIMHDSAMLQDKIAGILGLVENPIPESMANQLDSVLGWEKVSAETSVPVKNAAQAVKNAKTKGEIAKAMASLAFACTNYLEKNEGKLFKSSARRTAVLDLLISISDFYVRSDSGYYDVFAAGMKTRTYKKAKSFDIFIKNKLVTTEGEKDLSLARMKKRQLEKDRKTIDESKFLPGRREFNIREEYRKNRELNEVYTDLYGLSIPTEYDREDEFEDLKEKTPELSEDGYKIYEKFKNAGRYVYHPEYQRIYERAKKNYKKVQGGEYTREALNLLRQVNFDDNFNPISEDDKRNHEFNLNVLRTFERDDLEEREKIIAHELPRFLDDVELPTLITKEDILAWKNEKNAKKAAGLRSILRERLDLWVDDFLKNGNAAAFAQLHARSFSIDPLQKLHPGVKDFLKANQGVKAKLDTFGFLNNYIKAFSKKNYKVTIGYSAEVEETAGKSKDQLKKAEKDMNNTMDSILNLLLENMLNMYSHENDPTVPYKTDEKLQHEIDRRKEEIKSAREAEERRIRETAEHKKDMNESDSLLYDNIKMYQNRQSEAYRNAIDTHTTIQSEKPSVKEKRKNAKLLSDNVNSVIDAKVKLRMDTPLAVKKKVDYRTFTELSDIAYLIGGQEELEKLITETAEANKQMVANKKADEKGNIIMGTEGYQLLDYMTAKILKIDASSFDVSSDEAIAKNAVPLEKMARGVEAYRKMVLKFGGEDYFKYLSDKKLKGVDGNVGQMALCQLDSLSAIAKYYRTRKLIMEDEGYIERRRELTTGENPDDSFEMKRLKELQRISDKYALTLKQSTWDVNRTAFNVLYGMDKKIYEERKEKADKEGKQLPDRNAEEKTLNRLEHERFFVAPKWLQNALTITGENTRYQGDNPAYAAILTTYGDNYNSVYGHKNYGTKVYHDVVVEQKGKVKDGRFNGSPVFVGGKDEYLSKIAISDNWDRLLGQLTTPLSYRRTPAELREMMDILCIQSRDEWDKIKDDPEAAAFYESAFKEKTMQFLESIYANVKRVANSVGMQMLVMHPADLAMQVTARLRAELYGATVATNVDTLSNMPLVEKLFKENNGDGRFLFDVQDFQDMGSVTANTPWKTCNSGQLLVEVIEERFDFEEKDITKKELEKQLFGRTGTKEEGEKLKAKEVKALEDQINKQKEKGNADPDQEEELLKLKNVEPSYFFLKAHPEVFNTNTYCAKDPEGNYLFQYHYDLNGKSVYADRNAEGIRNVLVQGKLKKPKKSVLDKYEKSLKDRNMPGFISKKDPYGINLIRNNVEDLIKKDKDGKPVLKDGKLQFKSA